MIKDKLYNVPADVFYSFIEAKALIPKQGWTTHSTDYVDSNGNRQAYFESSSWNMNRTYRISDEGYSNLETIELINNKIK